jgi:hypothetical protein
MSFHTYFATSTIPLGYNPEAWGLSWIGATGGEGTVAISAGGYVTTKRSNANSGADEALPIPVHVRAVPGHPEELHVGCRVPGPDGEFYIGGLWCVYWADDE